MSHTHSNRLIHSSSPYLLQHAHNPVDWYPWGEEAFARARAEDKLVLVSIGYSACHWCHVMERESFEDEDTAALMNKYFICIKVDREERPDVDQVYMDAVQLITGQGGWPLNMFTLPDGRPLHGGTYFPRQRWQETLTALNNFYRTKKSEAETFAEDLTRGVRNMGLPLKKENSTELSFAVVREQVNAFKNKFDTVYGGYTWAPKFPMPGNWMFFLQYGFLENDQEIKDAVMNTLVKMAEGGIYDQVGGGFARYSTDPYWKVPHFEKMLYDNGQLLSLYAEAYKHNPLPLFKHVMQQTTEWLQREMTDVSGAFFSALDADSEGVEGKFYVWDKDELKQVLGEDELLFSMYYNVQPQGNWEHSNILFKTLDDKELEELTRKPVAEIRELINHCNQKLLAARAQRVRPALDDKVITSWNALTLKGLADAFMATGEQHFLDMALKNATFLVQQMYREGVLYRIFKTGQVSVRGFSEDYALLADSLIRLYEATLDETWLNWARQLVQDALDKFYDETSGLFFFTATDGEALVARKTDTGDDVIPSSNAVLAKSLFYLGFYFDEPGWRQKAENMLNLLMPSANRNLIGHSTWLQLALHLTRPFYQLVCSGPAATNNCHKLAALPLCNYLLAANIDGASSLPLVQNKFHPSQNHFHVCVNQSCLLPVLTLPEAVSQIRF